MIDHSHIGVVSEPRSILVERGQLRFFAQATGETDPVYSDLDAARAAGHPDLPAPPTYVFTLHLGAPAKLGHYTTMGVDQMKILHGDQGFEHFKPIHAGDTITLVTTTDDIYARKNGALEFVVQSTEARNEQGELCVRMKTTLIIRHEQVAQVNS